MLLHTNKTHLQKYGHSIYSNTVQIQKYLKEWIIVKEKLKVVKTKLKTGAFKLSLL